MLDSELMVQLYDMPEKNEGFRSFLEKRKTNFEGNFTKGMPQSVPWWDPINIVPTRKGDRNAKSVL